MQLGSASFSRSIVPSGSGLLEIRSSELDRIDIAIWIVHRLLPCQSVDDIELGVHGVCVRDGNRLGVYLPDVARKHGWTSQQLVEEACLKAGLRREMWREVDVELLEASCFGEQARPSRPLLRG